MATIPPLQPRGQNESSRALLGGLSLVGLTAFAALVVFYRPGGSEADMALSAVATRAPIEEILPRVAGAGLTPQLRASGSVNYAAQGGPIGEPLPSRAVALGDDEGPIDAESAGQEAMRKAREAMQQAPAESQELAKRALEAKENFKNQGFTTGPSAGGAGAGASAGAGANSGSGAQAPGAGDQPGRRDEGLIARSRSDGESAPRMPAVPRVSGGSDRIGAVSRAPMVTGQAQAAQAGPATRSLPTETLEARAFNGAGGRSSEALGGGMMGSQGRDVPPSGGGGGMGGTGGSMGAPPVGAGAPAPPCVESAEYTMWKNDAIRRDGGYQAQRDACNGVTEQNDARQKCHESLDKAFKESPPKPTCQEPETAASTGGGQGNTDNPAAAPAQRSGPPGARASCDRVTDTRARNNCHSALDTAFGSN